ncbi:hypothetical protein F5Y12DRAFT_736315 [Xylaria sp. FL1777]|nr:hypothetical protein F5Y12DRAFT_736315 [Xylaria sp. FL1777]
MSTSHSLSRRNSAATDLTLTESNTSSAYTTKEYVKEGKYLDDDDKTLSDLKLEDTSSKTKLSKAMAQLKSKLKPKEETPKQKRAPIPDGYYPSTLETFHALADSRL